MMEVSSKLSRIVQVAAVADINRGQKVREREGFAIENSTS